ncbi:hypothetical protein AB0N24_27040 [Arthrobacter sp. NPDC093128]|jgi:hypothetical protein|uniref:hypothetical protein n=1 Tax=Arthrobacter sp. NPDC093128 TaxID=3154979 RepID=UPI0034392286
MMITGRRKGAASIAVIVVIICLTGCAVSEQQAAAPQQSTTTPAALQHKEFDSVGDARRAVADVIGCDDEPRTDPIINPDIAGFTAEYVVCADRVQVEWFKTEEARNAEHELYGDSSQPLSIVEGENWMVVDMSEALGEPPSGKDLKRLAQELGGEFRLLNGAKSS